MTDGLPEIVNSIPLIPEAIEYIKNLYNSHFVQYLSLPGIVLIGGAVMYKLSNLNSLKNEFSAKRNLCFPLRREDAEGE